MKLPLPVGTYRLTSAPASARRLVNCYAEYAQPDGKGPVILYRAPGIKSFADVGTGPIRGAVKFQGQRYVVSGTGLYRVSAGGLGTLLGTIPGTGRVKMAGNVSALVIVAEPDAYVWGGTTLAQITDSDFTARGAGSVDFLDNYLLFREPGSGRFFCSDLSNATSYDSLNFATAEAAPDNLVGLIVDHREIILGGEDSIEIWGNAGSSGFPFARTGNGYIEQGVAAGDSMAKADQSVLWLANDLTVRRLDGATAARISNHSIEQIIQALPHVDDAFAQVYTLNGHICYVLTFPSADRTLVYDLTTREWNERDSYLMGRWRANAIATVGSQILVGDSQSGKVGLLDPDTYAEWTDPQVMAWQYAAIYADGARAFHHWLEVMLETGVGTATGQGSDPLMTLKLSNDSGTTFPLVMPTRRIGAQGARRTRVRWNKLGSNDAGGGGRVNRCEVSDPVKIVVHDTQTDVLGGRA